MIKKVIAGNETKTPVQNDLSGGVYLRFELFILIPSKKPPFQEAFLMVPTHGLEPRTH